MSEKNKPFKNKKSDVCRVIAKANLNRNDSPESAKTIIDPRDGRFPELGETHRDITS